MSERIVINLAKMTEAVGGHYENRLAPNGMMVDMPIWDGACYENALKALSYIKDEPNKPYYLTDVPSTWIIIALMKALEPAKVGYLYIKEDGEPVDMCTLERGVKAPADNYDAAFTIIEEGDKVFINMNTDRHGHVPNPVDGPHTFDIANLPKIVIPNIPTGKHVYMHAKGRFCVMDCIALNYLDEVKSFSIACHEDDYTCCYTTAPDEIKIGDVTKRTLENNL